MRPNFIEALDKVSQILPTTLLTNGTLFSQTRLNKIGKLKNREIRMQISLDHPDPISNDEMRGPKNFSKVVEVVPKLIKKGIRVRIATTVEKQDDQELNRLRNLIDSLGVKKEDHIIRKIVSRGRAISENLGVHAPLEKLSPELTITSEGAFWSPFAPTYVNGKLQTDLLICRKTSPLSVPAEILLDFMQQVPKSDSDDMEGFV